MRLLGFPKYNVRYNFGKVPDMWSKGIITSFPKPSTSDPRDPMLYRGLTLAPMAYELYRGVLIVRLTVKLDEVEVINEEQYSFRNIQLSEHYKTKQSWCLTGACVLNRMTRYSL